MLFVQYSLCRTSSTLCFQCCLHTILLLFLWTTAGNKLPPPPSTLKCKIFGRLNQLVKLYSICMQWKFRLVFDLPCITTRRGQQIQDDYELVKFIANYSGEPHFLCIVYSRNLSPSCNYISPLINALLQLNSSSDAGDIVAHKRGY